MQNLPTLLSSDVALVAENLRRPRKQSSDGRLSNESLHVGREEAISF